jgi:hypothetical protein
MTPRRRSFIRKIVYSVCILLLMLVLNWLGRPAIVQTAGFKGSPGGKLAQEQKKNKIEQVYLGKIDPASQTLRLATLGMRGIAANILWTKGIEYQKKKDWTNLSATLNQIIKLQPNFIDVWRHQGWNLSYNCSVEFDDYRQRYHWVIKGIEFLQLGTTYNEREPRLLRDIGWFIAQKIGRADEHKQFRRLFREDDVFNAELPKSQRDNWLVGKEWFRKAERLIDTEDVSERGMNPLVFRSQAPMCQMNCAAALEKEGVFGEKAKKAWKQAAKDWYDFGKFAIRTSSNYMVHLGELERLEKDRKKLVNELDNLAPGVREKIHEQRFSQLTDEQRKALETPESQRTSKQRRLAQEAAGLLGIKIRTIFKHSDVPKENRNAAKEIEKQINFLDFRIGMTARYRGVVNYDYWRLRADIEQEKELLTARKAIYEANDAFNKSDLKGAKDAFELGSVNWARVLAQQPLLKEDKATSDDIEDLLEQYARVLDQDDQLFPPNFALAPYVSEQIQQSPKMPRIRMNYLKAVAAEQKDDLLTAVSFYRKTLNAWKLLLADFPSLQYASDPVSCAAILEIAKKYDDTLKKIGKPLPGDFPLHGFIRVQLEHDPETEAAQIALQDAESKANEKQWAAATKSYEQAFKLWRRVLDRYPTAIGDTTVGEDLIVWIDQYRACLKKENREMPKNFDLQEIVDRYGK